MLDDCDRSHSEQAFASWCTKRFSIKASFMPFTLQVFQRSPFYGPDAEPQMSLRATLLDTDGVLHDVVFGTSVIETIAETNVDALADVWGECDDTEAQTRFLAIRNKDAAGQFVFSCRLRPYHTGSYAGTANPPRGGELPNGVAIQIDAHSAHAESDDGMSAQQTVSSRQHHDTENTPKRSTHGVGRQTKSNRNRRRATETNRNEITTTT